MTSRSKTSSSMVSGPFRTRLTGRQGESLVEVLANQSFERTGHERRGSLRSVNAIVARRSTQIR